MTTAALAAEFGEDEDSFVDALGALDDDRIVWLLGDRWADALSLLAGRVVTHRLTSVEGTYDVLTTSPDLELVRSVPDRYRRLVSGELLGTVFPGLAEPDQRDIPEEVRDRDGSFVLPVRTMSVLQVEPVTWWPCPSAPTGRPPPDRGHEAG